MTQTSGPSLLDPTARAVVDRLHATAQRQFRSMIGHYLSLLPNMVLGRPLPPAKDMSYFDDKLIPLEAAQGELLYLLTRTSRARCAVEFGTSFGVSTIYLAAAVRDAGAGGRVIGTELVPAKAAQARANLAAAGLADHVEVREGDALTTLRDLAEPVDVLLLDGWPQLAIEVLRVVEPRLADGAVIMVDNVGQFAADLRPVVERLSAPPYRAAMIPLRGGTLTAVYAPPQ
jgi:predicted O-methyltransferase YrrM